MSEILERLGEEKVFAVLVIDCPEDAVPLARALAEGGVRAMELALRTPAAIDALRAIRADVPEMTAGVGTVLSPEQVDQVVEAGAGFAMAPGFNPRVVQRAQEVGLPFVPGIVTPTDIELAMELGCRTLKFFPAEPSGGLKYLRSIAAPFAQHGVRYVPLGGINAENAADYIEEPLILAVGGSWIAPRKLIEQGDFKTITENASWASSLVEKVRVKQER